MALKSYTFKIKFTDGTQHKDVIMAETWADAFPQVMEIAVDVVGDRDVKAIIVNPVS